MIRFSEESAAWVFGQQAVSRVFVAFKFFILARLLGPNSIGLMAACLMALSIAESLTDIGIGPALIQRRDLLGRRELDSLWTATAFRGLLLSAGMLALSASLANLMNISQGIGVLQLVSLVPLARCTASMGIVIAQRERRFRTIACLSFVFSTIDFVVSGAVAYLTGDVFIVIAVLPLCEFLKSIVSHFVFSTSPHICFEKSAIKGVMEYGRWVWLGSLLTTVVNQIDRIIVANLFGVQILGLYQTASRLAQFGVADFGIALGQYLFPNLAELARRDRQEAVSNAINLVSYLGVVSFVVATFLYVSAAKIIQLSLGEQWKGAVSLFRVFVFLMAAGVLAAVLVACLRATGKPGLVTRATAVQLMTFLVTSIPLIHLYGALGVAFASSISVCCCVGVMLRDVVSEVPGAKKQLLPLVTVGMPAALIVLVVDQLLNGMSFRTVIVGATAMLVLVFPILKLRAHFALSV